MPDLSKPFYRQRTVSPFYITGAQFITSKAFTSCNNLMEYQSDSFAFDPIEDALDAFARGEFLVVMDDEGRENEGDLIIAASQCTTENMAWMIKHTRSVMDLCLERILQLRTVDSFASHFRERDSSISKFL
jgi:3,4-dihydroxy-2-butanone 4-phosphate synthase